MLAFLVAIIPFAVAFAVWSAGATLQLEFETVYRDLVQSGEVFSGKEPASPEALETQLKVLLERADSLRHPVARNVLLGQLLSASLVASGIFVLFVWMPFIAMRAKFASEIERFTLRIQGLASKSELAELAVLEATVSDEDSLRSFIKHARVIATRHAVPQLVTRFDLWSLSNDRAV
ncbi:MAG: hypothetical protein KIT09_34000 [Bryobacteraceae bacterium]|nr:hypothetical protein [Bryobacteraceae bacterium]